MQTTMRKTDVRQTREQVKGTCEKKRLDVLRQANRAAGIKRQEMTGSKINEVIGDLIATGELELLGFGQGGRHVKTTAKGIAAIKAGTTKLADVIVVRNEDNTFGNRDDANNFIPQNTLTTRKLGKAIANDYDTLATVGSPVLAKLIAVGATVKHTAVAAQSVKRGKGLTKRAK